MNNSLIRTFIYKDTRGDTILRIYSSQKTESFSELLGYQCDNCSFRVTEENLPIDFIEEHDKHYCFECQAYCKSCLKMFSIPYIKSWFRNGLCENCQDNFKEVK